MKNVVTALVLVLLVAGCDLSTDPGAGVVQGLGPPVATGLFLMDEARNALGTWRQPTEGGLRSFPNPSGGTTIIQFQVLHEGQVRMWVVPALPPEGASGPQTAQILGGNFFIGGGQPAVVLLNESIPAGVHQVAFNMNSPYLVDEPLPTGFYRIYLETPDGVSFVDHFGVGGDDYWLPAGLEDLFY